MTRRTAPWLLTGVLALALSACGAEDDETAPSAQADVVTISDPWVKAADEGMTAGFGILENSGDDDVTVVAVSSPASSALELHETVDDGTGQMTMQEKEGGFVIPAGGSLELEPGGNHLMFMSLTAPIVAGDDVELSLEFADGSTYEFTAPAKDYAGANENYGNGEHDMDMEHMS